MITSVDGVSSVDVSSLPPCPEEGASPDDYVTGISHRLVTLERRLKALEHVRTDEHVCVSVSEVA